MSEQRHEQRASPLVPQARERVKLPIADRWRTAIEHELQQHGDVLPPWRKYPDLERYSIGWRMGPGEVYIGAWWEWTEPFDREQRIAYFKRYVPHPPDWLDWIAYDLGMEKRYGMGLTAEEQEAVRSWLADQGVYGEAARKQSTVSRWWRSLWS